MGLATGQRLGPYEIVAPLGAGGMGEVWRARDARLGRDVAIKVLPAGLAQGRFFYYLDSRRLLRMPVEGGAPTQFADSVGFLNLTVTDRGVYFITLPDEGGRSVLYRREHATRTIRPLATLDGRVGQGMTVSPNGRSLLFTPQEKTVQGFP